MEECPVCLEQNTDFVSLCCKKHFHNECFLKCAPTCPLCRAHFVRVPEVEPEAPQPMLCYIIFKVVCYGIITPTIIFYVAARAYLS